MRAFILAGLFSSLVIVAFGLSAIAADTPPSDAVIQQRIVGTWLMTWIAFNRTTTIGTNGDYVAYYTSPPVRQEGTIEIREGLMIDTIKKSSITNRPLPLVSTNVIIRLTDHELLFRAQGRSQPIMWKRRKQ